MRRLRSRNDSPSAVRLTLRVERWKSRTPSSLSRRAIVLPTAEAEIPSSLPAAVKLRVCAARTNALIERTLSVGMMIVD